MKRTELEKLVFRFFSKTIKSSELDELSIAIQDKNHNRLFREYVKINYLATYNMCDFSTKEEKEKLLKTIEDLNKTRPLSKIPLFRYGIVATIVIFLFCLALISKNTTKESPLSYSSIIKSDSDISPGTDKAVLTLDDGKEIVLGEGDSYSSNGVVSDSEKIVYENSSKKNIQPIYNSLTIPIGGQFQITLSDGTKVWLNSDTKIKYPVHFTKGKSREVELLYGEAYFDVSESIYYEEASFKVINIVQNIEVIGTEFNVKAYEGQENIITTLVEGMVNISVDNKNNILTSGMQSSVNVNSKTIHIGEVDVTSAIAWKNGFFSFENETLHSMLVTLQRWYEIDVEFENQSKKNIVFSGILKRTDDVETLLLYLQKTGQVDFEISDNKIIVK